jgi:hypothetical protein
MPAIEIICPGQKSPSKYRGIPFPVLSETKLKSHRYPSHFQEDFDRMSGCIYHLGSPCYKGRRGGFFEAYELLSPKCLDQESPIYLEFRREFLPSVKRILKSLLQKSPTREIVFTSDYQGSPNRPRRFERIPLKQFWSLHRTKKLRFNALYVIPENEGMK